MTKDLFEHTPRAENATESSSRFATAVTANRTYELDEIAVIRTEIDTPEILAMHAEMVKEAKERAEEQKKKEGRAKAKGK